MKGQRSLAWGLINALLLSCVQTAALAQPVGSEARVWTNTTTGGQAWDNARQCAAGISSDEAGGMWT